MTYVHSLVADDYTSIEFMMDFGDSEQEQEEKKTKERKINHSNSIISLKATMSDALLSEMMHSVDLQSLFHPEITTPPPEQI